MKRRNAMDVIDENNSNSETEHNYSIIKYGSLKFYIKL